MADSPAELQNEIETLERKHAANPEGRYFVPLSNAYRKAGALDHAEALLREGLRRHPDYLSAHIVLGRCMADRGAVQDAMEEFRYVLSLDPQNLIALRTLGELAFGAGRVEEAQRWYGELLSVDPMNEDARRALESLQATGVSPADEEFQAGADWWQPPVAPAPEPTREQAAAAEQPAYAPVPDDAYGTFVDLDGDTSFSDGGEPLGAPALPEEEGAVEVVTETIAELYARQGFLDRSIDVYRELIRRRNGDPALERRLAELERQASGGYADGAAPDPEPEPIADAVAEPVEEPAADARQEPALLDVALPAAPADEPVPAEDTFADSFGSGFSFANGGAEAGEEGWIDLESRGEPELPELQPVAAGPSIAEFLGELIAWRPGARPEQTAAGEPLTALPALSRVENAPAEEPVEGAVEAGGMDSAEEEPFPWEVGGVAVDEHETGAAAEGEGVEPVESFSFDAFLAEEAPAAPPLAPPSQPVTPQEDEDDLESFQAWLRSLKR